ncbi:MAG: hypothetical protein ACT4P1_05380 [Sporichthyaceae bacterium]
MVRTSRRSPAAVLALLAVIAMLLMSSQPAGAAPYVDDATVGVSTTNPAVGGTVTLSLSGFAPNEPVDLDLHSTVVRLTTVQADANGSAVVTVSLPPDFRCAHFITGTGLISGEIARVDIFIGSSVDCPGNANGDNNSGNNSSGNNNSGINNSGSNNSGFNNSGNGNSGFNNRGNNNSGFNNSGSGNSGLGAGNSGSGSAFENPGFATTANTASAPDVGSGGSHGGTVLAWSVLAGLAVVGGAGFLRRRRLSA